MKSAESPYSASFIREIHRRFYTALPEALRSATSVHGSKRAPLVPGQLRLRDVGGRKPRCRVLHVSLFRDSLRIFSERYGSRRNYRNSSKSFQSEPAIIDSSGIHPFRDGNGRVVRIFSDTLIRNLGIGGAGLWSLSRGFALHREEYYERLSNADRERSGTSADDGRGHLSERTLWEFCHFTLTIMIDQIAFMERVLDLDGLERRIERYVMTAPLAGVSAERVFFAAA